MSFGDLEIKLAELELLLKLSVLAVAANVVASLEELSVLLTGTAVAMLSSSPVLARRIESPKNADARRWVNVGTSSGTTRGKNTLFAAFPSTDRHWEKVPMVSSRVGLSLRKMTRCSDSRSHPWLEYMVACAYGGALLLLAPEFVVCAPRDMSVLPPGCLLALGKVVEVAAEEERDRHREHMSMKRSITEASFKVCPNPVAWSHVATTGNGSNGCVAAGRSSCRSAAGRGVYDIAGKGTHATNAVEGRTEMSTPLSDACEIL